MRKKIIVFGSLEILNVLIILFLLAKGIQIKTLLLLELILVNILLFIHKKDEDEVL